jgi:hypothetical protein
VHHDADRRQARLAAHRPAYLPDPECAAGGLFWHAAWSGITTPGGGGGTGVTLIGGKPAACMGDIVMEPCAVVPLPPPNTIVTGEMTVLIGQGGGGAVRREPLEPE